MRTIFISLLGGLILVACDSDSSNEVEQGITWAVEADEKSDISNPPNPCSILSAGTAQAELGAKSVSRFGAGVINLARQSESESTVVSWTGLVWAGESDRELIVESTVATDAKSPAERGEVANALAELYVGTVRQMAAMGQ